MRVLVPTQAHLLPSLAVLSALAPPNDGDGVTPVYVPPPQGPGSVSPTIETPVLVGAPSGFTDWSAIISKGTAALATPAVQADPAKAQAVKASLAVAAASAPIPVVGWVVAAVATAVAGVLAFFGIKGSTAHVDKNLAATKCATFVDRYIVPMFLALPPDAQSKFIDLTIDFDNGLMTNFGGAWGGVVARDRGTPQSFNHSNFDALGGPQQVAAYLRQGWPYYLFLWELMTNADAETVDANLKQWYFDPLSAWVLKPLDAYMVATYNKTVAQYEGAGVTLPPGLSIAGVNLSSIGSIAGIGLAVLGLGFALSRPGRRS